jgi:hypothetical protein
VVEWRSVCVENPKGEPTAEERDALRAAKEAEKKSKAVILERVNARCAEVVDAPGARRR